MKNKESTKTVIVVLTSVGLVVFSVVFLPWIMVFLGMISSPKPLTPEITYGEFPFRLEYEMDGEVVVVEDTVICEYDGIGMNEDIGKYRKWKSHLTSNGEESILIVSDGTREIYCYIGDAEYYMGDEKCPEQRPLTPRLYMIDPNLSMSEITMKDEIIDSYNITLISWQFSEPLENAFE